MKNLLALAVSLLAMINIQAATVDDMPSDATTLASKMKVGWNLGNSLESYVSSASDQEVSWGNPRTTQAMIDSVKAAGFNTIRIPVRWYPHFTYINGNVTLNATWLARVKEMINYCLKDGLYVIINTHHELWLEDHSFYADSASVYKELHALWKELAMTFADYDEHLLLAGTNEVHLSNWSECTTENATVQNRYNQIFIDEVRASGGRNTYRNLIVQTFACSDTYGPKHLVLPKDPTPSRMMVEVHCYEPYTYAGDEKETVKYWGKPYKNLGVGTWGQEDYVDNIFNTLKTKYVNNGYPVIMGEFGAIRHTTTASTKADIDASRAYYYKYIITKAKACGVVPFMWDNGITKAGGSDSFGLFDRRNNMSQVDDFTIKTIMEAANATDYPYSAITTVTADDASTVNVYNLNGQTIKTQVPRQSALDTLPHGIYIVGGRKIIK